MKARGFCRFRKPGPRHAFVAGAALALFGVGMIQGCTNEQRHQYLNNQWQMLLDRIEQLLIRDIGFCQGDSQCIAEARARAEEAENLLREWYEAELAEDEVRANDAEDAWDEWLRNLDAQHREIWEVLREYIDAIKDLVNMLMEGEIEVVPMIGVPGPLALASSSGDDDGATVTTPEALGIVIDSAQTTGGELEMIVSYRLATAGTVEIEGDLGLTIQYNATTAVIMGAPVTITDGTRYPLTGGNLKLINNGQLTKIKVVPGLQGEGLYLYNDGRGLLRFYGEPVFASPSDDIVLGERLRFELPVQHLVDGTVYLTSHGEVPLGYMGEWDPHPISDANLDGLYTSADDAAFAARLAAQDPTTDLNFDGLFDLADADRFAIIHAEDAARSQFNATR